MSMRGNPFDELERLFERMNRQLEATGQWWENDPLSDWAMEGNELPIDLADRGNEFVVTVDVPGYGQDEIDVRMTDNTVRIEADSREETERSEENLLRSERHRRSLSRSIRLPDPVHPDQVNAKLRNGILTITLPKMEPDTESHHIDIESE